MMTSDGVEIEEDLRVWTNELKPGKVKLPKDWEGWFIVQCDDGYRVLQNGERVSTVHPFTGKRA